MPGKGPKKKPPLLAKGARVELAPYQGGQVFADLGWLDGHKGTVSSVGPGDPPRTIYVKLDGTPGAVGYPIEAIRPLEEGK